MTDWIPGDPDPTRPERPPRRCRRHVWVRTVMRRGRDDLEGNPTYDEAHYPSDEPGAICLRCGKVRDETATRRGRSSRRLGGDQERRIERVYGPRKRGEYGDAVDHVGHVWKWQSKATRQLPPKWLAAIDWPTHRGVTQAVADAWNGMRDIFPARRPVVIRSFVSRGVRTRDWLFVSADDAVAEFGAVIPFYTGWWVIPGDWWLDHFGQDKEGDTE